MAPDHPPRVDWRPAPDDGLLLQALLLPGQLGQSAGRAWAARVPLDEVGPAAFRLLPNLYQMLLAAGSETPDLARLKGIQRKTWYENQIQQAGLGQMVAALAATNIACLLLHGAISTATPSAHASARNISDMAAAVRPEQAPAALAALARLGWRPAQRGSRPQRDWRYLTGIALRPPANNYAIKLIWRLPWDPPGALSLAGVCARSQPANLAGQTARAPDPTDQLWLACLEGALWHSEPDYRWALDAVRLIVSGAVDWARLQQQSRETATTLPVREVLAFLAAERPALIPAEALRQLQSAPLAPAEARRYRLLSRRQGRLGAARRHWLRYTQAAGQRANPLGFARYLEAEWAVDSSGQVLREIARRGWLGVERTFRA